MIKRKEREEKEKTVRNISIMYQICGALSCKNYGKKLQWEQNEGFIFHHRFVVKVFHYKKKSDLRGEIDIGLNVKLSIIVVRFKERLGYTDELLNITLHKNQLCGSGVAKRGRTDTLQF